MKYYTVIDTNVLVSAALKHRSVPGIIVRLAFEGPIVPVLNKEIENEYREVLYRPKFHFNQEIIDPIITAFRQRGLYVDAETINIEFADPKDRVFYEVVMQQKKEKDTYLVTGNIRHFPKKPFVVTPRQMLDIILRDQDTR